MATMRVHELAKEFGMSSKDLLARLEELKIPARNHASTLVDAYVDKIRKELGPELAERSAALEMQRDAEEAARVAAIEAEAARLAEERRRAEEAEHARREEERLRREAEEAARLAAIEAEKEAKHQAQRDAVPQTIPSISNDLLSRIAAENERLAAVKEAEKAVKEAAKVERDAARKASKSEKRATKEAAPAPAAKGEPVPIEAESEDDRYRKMAVEAEKLQRDKVLEEARAAVAAATNEGTGRRKKKKEKRAKEEAERIEAAPKPAGTIVGSADASGEVVSVETGITVGDFADILGVPANDIIKRLFMLGTPLTVNQPMNDELVEIVADDMGRSVRILTPEEEGTFHFEDAEEDLKPRAPVVTVMGHVDHGKTSLLDAIRSSGVAATEAGGITQHIGASVVHTNGRQITFIDTPGHEAFTAMRARGAAVTDVVVLVVAADDSVMPQTVEAIHHAKAAGVPIVIAVNKIDKDGANPDKVRQELTEHGIVPEEWGGENMFVNVSAKKRINIDELLETILLQADVLELKANPDTTASGYVIEANLDKGRGPVATVLVHRGTLRVGDTLVAGTAYGRVRALIDPKGKNVKSALPSDPVEIVGLSSVPAAGDEFAVFEDEREARNLAEERALKQRLRAQEQKRHVSLENLFEHLAEGEMKELNLVVKADVQGSIEALKDALDKMDQSEVRINVIHSAVGGITETDVTLADASDAVIIGFGVRPSPKARALAEAEKVDIRTYRVIYQALEDINAARVGMLSPDIVEVDTATAEIRDLFRVPKAGVIAGCYVTHGELSRDDLVRVVRDGTVVFEGKMHSLRRFKDDVKSVKQGYECGVGIEGFQDLKEGDLIEGYKITEVAREA